MTMSKKIFLLRALALLLATLILFSLPLTSCQHTGGGTETTADGTDSLPDSQPDSTSPGETSGGEAITLPGADGT